MNFFGIGLPEMAVIAAIGLLVFGPKRLPELGKTLGRTLKGFQSASTEFEKEFRTAMEPAPGPKAEELKAEALLPAEAVTPAVVEQAALGPDSADSSAQLPAA
jgi:sec-independent protein translocase protein TatA